ncbi:hypothetical protein CAPTEDRAFT_212839 [Capitella teleta]|uniref:UspA domain-containing protein n=1 Tax=Capitella teleta TaxID=283909 RepID=R7V4E4_CAPTE|nr:hypothetical protein CAPTEDRAFT_212839 [Capitella teleta]|eukprot:ELU11216.1 hypothetical protein CAPTEDRAFT_212839 [Capitella teleta]
MEQAIRRPSVGCIEIPKVQTEHRALKKTNSSAPGAQPRADTALTRCAPDIACVRRTKVKERCVCLAVNGGSLSELVFQWYLDNTHRPGNRLVLIHVLEEIHTNLFPDEINRTSSSVESEYQRSLQNSAELKTRLSTKLNKLGVSFKFVARYGQPARVIVTVVQEEDADLVVVGYQVQGRLQRLLTGGSIANHVTKHAHCPVLVCRHKMKQKPTGWSDDDDDFRERRRGSERRGRRSKPRAMWETLVRTIKRE